LARSKIFFTPLQKLKADNTLHLTNIKNKSCFITPLTITMNMQPADPPDDAQTLAIFSCKASWVFLFGDSPTTLTTA
jgi:hypothetical protein